MPLVDKIYVHWETVSCNSSAFLYGEKSLKLQRNTLSAVCSETMMRNGYSSHNSNGVHGHSNGVHEDKGELPKSVVADLPWQRISYKLLFFVLFALPAVIIYAIGGPWWTYPIIFLVSLLPAFLGFLITFNYISYRRTTSASEIAEFVEFRDEMLAKKFETRKMPFETLLEAFADERLDFKGDVLEALEKRENFSTFELTWNHLKIFCCNFLPELLSHSRMQDLDQVRDHYDRGNDFYEAFLGSMMVYTAGILKEEGESLEQLQLNKLNGVCEKINLKEGDKHLDIGCGWGTLVNFAADHRGAKSTGISISKNQVEWARDAANKRNLSARASFLCVDYRDIPNDSYDKITCLEMAEHVGVLHFQSFMCQVRDLMKDDGVFFLQIAGLRRAWQWEDFVWGLFMDKYIFPGADASCPLAMVVQQLEAAGFEVANVETVGIHYSYTIHRWYQNWVRPATREAICAKYGTRLYRIWEIFLAWSTIIARQGNSTCFQIVCHKNLNEYDRSKHFQIKK